MATVSNQRGVTLIELMVGMVIGLLVTLVIAQVAKVYEGNKRNTTAGADAQVNGAIALHTLQRDLLAAGYGLTSKGASGCPINGRNAGTLYTWTLAPVIITDGANDAPDALQTLSSNRANFALPVRVFSAHLRNATEFVLGNSTTDLTNIGNAVGDLMVAIPADFSACSLFQVSRVCGAGAAAPCTSVNGIRHDTVDATSGIAYAWNQDGNAAGTVFPGLTSTTVSYESGSTLVNVGTLADRIYSIVNNGLHLSEFQSTTPATRKVQELFPQIVNLQAVYGKDTDGDKVIDAWNTTLPTSHAEWAQVLAVRVALVSRSTQYEPEAVTTAQPTWTPNGTTAATLKINHLPDWQHYRYRVFETVVPLRNMIWQS